MKKSCFEFFLMVFVIILFSNTVFAQGAYMNMNAGYGRSMSAQNLDFFGFTNYASTNNAYAAVPAKVSLGKGLNVGAAFGYMFNKNIGAELGVSYLIGSKSKLTDLYERGTTDYTLSAKMLRINPSLVIASGFEKINPYAKFGFIIGSGSIMYEYTDNDDGDIEVLKMKLNGGVAMGLSSGIGALLNISDKMSFYAELNMLNVSYAPTKGKVTEATYNGADELPDLTKSATELEFVDSKTYAEYYFNNPSADLPSKQIKQKLPFGSVGLNIGLRIHL